MPILHSLILGKGKPLLILHGLFGMGDNWKTLANKFAEDFEVHVIDQRNHGRSFHSDDFSYELMNDDLLNYLDHYNLQKVNLLGHSMGGKTAMLFAVTYPKRVDKIIVADIAPKYYKPHHQFIFEALQAIDFSNLKSRNEIDFIFKKYISNVGIRQFLAKNIYRKTKDEFAYRFNLNSLIDNIEKLGQGFSSNKKFTGEILFLKGENSDYITNEDTELIKSQFPMAKIVVIKNAGHWLHAENPVSFYENVVWFLKNA